MMASKYSVLMSVYHKEKPEYLKQAIERMLFVSQRTVDLEMHSMKASSTVKTS